MVGFFDESEGHKSMMRRMSWWLLMFFIYANFVFATIYTYLYFWCVMSNKATPEISSTAIWIDCVLLLFCFAPKAGQKLIEMRFGIKPDEPKTTTTEQTVIQTKTEEKK